MCTTWHTVATRDTRLLRRQLDAVNALPKKYVFLNYLRCHDDIGWGLDYEWLKQCFGTDEVQNVIATVVVEQLIALLDIMQQKFPQNYYSEGISIFIKYMIFTMFLTNIGFATVTHTYAKPRIFNKKFVKNICYSSRGHCLIGYINRTLQPSFLTERCAESQISSDSHNSLCYNGY